jgi:YegS/Rv2252/BmrU family lipid kinase
VNDRLFCVINPTAAGGRAGRLWPNIQKYLRKLGLSFEAGLTTAPREATRLAREATEAGFGTVVAVGGDGTINEVVNGLIAPGQERAVARLGIITTGRGSDLARTVGIPSDYEAACERLADPRTMPMDLGLAEYTVDDERQQRFFVNVAGIGFDAEVARRANRSFRSMGGTIPYLSALVTTLFRWRNRPAQILLDERPAIETKVYLVAVGNGQFFGGGMRVAPDADPNDGLFDVVVVHDIGKIEFLRTVPRVYEGTHVTHRAVAIHRAHRVEVRCESYPLLSQLDGEEGGVAPLVFQVVPGALDVLV